MRTKSKTALVLGIMAVMVACAVSVIAVENSHDSDADTVSTTFYPADDVVTINESFNKSVSGPGILAKSYYSITGASWLTISNTTSSTITVSGTPTTAGTYDIVISGPFAQGGGTATWEWTITVQSVPTYTLSIIGHSGNIVYTISVASGGTTALPDADSLENGLSSSFNFHGYYTTSTTSGTYIGTTGTNITMTSDQTIYAVWTAKTYTHTIAYDVNGGSGAPATQTATNTSVWYTMTISDKIPTRSGYTFTGWAIISSSNVIIAIYQPGDTLSVKTQVTLNAVWEATTTYTISYNLNGGQAGDSNTLTATTVLSGNSIYLPINNVTKAGYYLNGWNEGSTSGTLYSPGAEYRVISSKTMYANWIAIDTNVIDSNAPSSIDVGENYSYDPDMISDLWLSLSYDNSTTNYSLVWINHPSWLTYSKSEYMYDSGLVHRQAWQYTFSGTPAEVGIYNVKIQVGNTSDTIQWTITVTDSSTMGNYQVSFSAGSGSGSAASQSGVLGSAIKLPSSGFAKDGYRLAYWSTTIDGTTVYYPLGSIYTITEDKVFTAFYVANNGIIIFDANGGTVSDTTSSYMAYIVQTDGVVTLPSSGLVKDGATFAGWYLSSDNTSIYAPGYLYRISSVSNTIVMMAYWLPDTVTYEVVYNANGGVGALSQTIEEGYKVVMPTGGYVYNGHVLASWNTSQDGSGTSYALGAKVQIYAYVTLYAQWTVSSGTTGTTYSVTFDLNGAFGATQSQSVESGGMAIKPTDPTRPYYGFMYWQLSGSTGKYDFSTAVTSDIVLKAVWVKLFTLSTSGTVVTVTITAQYAAGSATIVWGDGSENAVGNTGTYSHEYQENTIGTISLTLVVGSGSNTVTYTSYAGYSVGATTGGNADVDDDNDSSHQIITDKILMMIIIVVIIIVIGAAAYVRFGQ